MVIFRILKILKCSKQFENTIELEPFNSESVNLVNYNIDFGCEYFH